jgi:hypothetical protein
VTSLRRPASIEPRPSDGRITAAVAAVVSLPIVVATIRALLDGWEAVGDNGNFLIRSRDVLTSNHPLLGTWSSASFSLGHDVNHPGPLMFDVLAIPAKLGGAGGMAVGVMVLHVACVAAIAWFAQRVGGLRLAAASLAAAAALSWTMGSQLLFDPWNPHVVLLPVLLLLVLVVAMASGDLVALPVAVGVASLVVETHLSYLLLLPPLCAWGLGWLVYRRRREVVPAALVALAVVFACWVQPLVDQVTGEGNLGTLVSGAGSGGESIGVGLGVRVAADVVAVPPAWSRPSFDDAITVPKGQAPLIGERPNIAGLPSARTALVALALFAGLLAVAWVVARRRHDLHGRVAIAAAAVAFVVALGVTVTLPVGGVGVPPHQVRYLWPIAIFATVVALACLLPRRAATGGLLGASLLLSALTLPTYDVHAGPNDDADAIPILRALADKLGPLEDEGTLLYDTSHLRFAEPWTSGVMAVLQSRGIDFTVNDPVWVRQLGSGREDHGAADGRIYIAEGDAAADVPDGERRIALVEGLDRAEQTELATLERSLMDVPVRLNDDGKAAERAGNLPAFAEGTPTAEQLLSFGGLAALLNAGLLDEPADRAADLDRYADLRQRWDRHTVALFLDPTPYD